MRVRQMESKDVEQVTELCGQFAYPGSREEVEERFHHLERAPSTRFLIVLYCYSSFGG